MFQNPRRQSLLNFCPGCFIFSLIIYILIQPSTPIATGTAFIVLLHVLSLESFLCIFIFSASIRAEIMIVFSDNKIMIISQGLRKQKVAKSIFVSMHVTSEAEVKHVDMVAGVALNTNCWYRSWASSCVFFLFLAHLKILYLPADFEIISYLRLISKCMFKMMQMELDSLQV